MYLSSSSAAGIRFLASVKHGHGLKPSARQAGIDKEVGYRWLRGEYLRLRRGGKTPSETTAELGFTTSRLLAWEADVGQVRDRHHLRVNVDEEASFWAASDRGKSPGETAKTAGVGRSTAYRWMHSRLDQLRQSRVTVRRCQGQLRLTDRLSLNFERERLSRLSKERNAATAAQYAAVLSSGRYADQMLGAVLSAAQQHRAARAERYWQLMRSGVSNAEACRLLGMHRRTGTQLRRASNFQIPPITVPSVTAGRYLDARERLRIADLLRLGHSMRRIAVELGRHASTIKRELDRHRDAQGLYLPRTADHEVYY
jgi:transposase